MADSKISFDTYHNVINNEFTTTETTRQAICPTTEEPLWDVPVSTQADVDRAVSAARVAYPAWKKLSQDERAGYLVKLADAIAAHKQEFIELLGREAGKPPQAAGFEFFLVEGHITEVPKLRLPVEKPEDNDDRTATVRWIPLGVGVAIVPWNFPLLLGIGKLFPALLAGNTFIWKPSPYTPYSGLKVAELASKILPPGVVQALSGEEDLGPLFTSHSGVDKISFTGSTATGKKIMAACAATLKRVTLEMGGNDAAIVCEDVDIDQVVGKVGFLSFVHSGQICMDVKRIYVHESIYDAFLTKLVAFIKSLKSGGFADAEAFFGPIQNSMQYRKLQDFYSEINKQGWKTALGGKVHDADDSSSKGYFVDPTIIDNPPEDSRIVVDEPFGPIVPVLKWTDEEDVIRRANDSPYGLGASVWSKDVPRATKMAEQLEAGSVWVNTHFEIAPHVPFGGHKQSGLGMEWGITGLKGWCNPQAVWVKHSGA